MLTELDVLDLLLVSYSQAEGQLPWQQTHSVRRNVQDPTARGGNQ